MLGESWDNGLSLSISLLGLQLSICDLFLHPSQIVPQFKLFLHYLIVIHLLLALQASPHLSENAHLCSLTFFPIVCTQLMCMHLPFGHWECLQIFFAVLMQVLTVQHLLIKLQVNFIVCDLFECTSAPFLTPFFPHFP